MRFLAWNCWVAGKAPADRPLKALVREEGPDVVFVSETKSKASRVENFRLKLGFFHHHTNLGD